MSLANRGGSLFQDVSIDPPENNFNTGFRKALYLRPPIPPKDPTSLPATNTVQAMAYYGGMPGYNSPIPLNFLHDHGFIHPTLEKLSARLTILKPNPS